MDRKDCILNTSLSDIAGACIGTGKGRYRHHLYHYDTNAEKKTFEFYILK